MVDLGSCRSSGDRTRLFKPLDPKPPIFRTPRLPPSLASKDHHCSILRLFLAFQTHSQYCTNWMRNSGLPDLSCDGLLAQSRYFLHQEQSGPAISQPLTPDPDFPPDTLNIFAIHSRLHRCQRPEDIATSASKGEEPVNRDCSSR